MSKTPKPAPGRPVGIWIRVSTEDQAKGESPERHEKRARLYAESKGWDVREVYHLEGVSGKSVGEHPECKRMLADVCRGRINALIFSKLARLARNTRDLLDFSETFREANCDLVSLQESIDTSTPAGRLFYTMIAAMAQWEREEIADRITSALAIKAKMGKPLNGKAPFGYEYKDGDLAPHPKEAPIRKRMYELFLKTKRIRTTAKLLNEAGYRTRGGGLFAYTAVKRSLTNPTAKGVHIINFSKNMGRGKSWVIKPREEWVERKVEAIIPVEMWEEANKILADRKEGCKRPGPRPVQLFSGLVVCHCGCRMYPRVNTPKYVCSSCHSKIPIDVLENIFRDQLKGFFLSQEEVERSLQAASEETTKKRSHLEAHEKELAKVKAEIDRIYLLYQSGGLEPDGFARFFRPLQERERQLQDELPRLQAEVDVASITALSSEQVIAEARDLHARWPDLTFEEKRSIVESITENIVITKDSVDINLCYLPSSEDMTKKHRILCHAGSEQRPEKQVRARNDGSRVRVAGCRFRLAGSGCRVG